MPVLVNKIGLKEDLNRIMMLRTPVLTSSLVLLYCPNMTLLFLLKKKGTNVMWIKGEDWNADLFYSLRDWMHNSND